MTKRSTGRSDEDVAFDQAVGRRIREARQAVSLNQAELGVEVGVTFQQIQKYETGANRVSASRMVLISRTLGVTNGHLMGEGSVPTAASREAGEKARLIAHYDRCADRDRRTILELAARLAALRSDGTAARDLAGRGEAP